MNNKPEVTFVADDQILEAYLVVAETVVMGISSPNQILIYCEWMVGKGDACWILKTGSQHGQKVKLHTVFHGAQLQLKHAIIQNY